MKGCECCSAITVCYSLFCKHFMWDSSASVKRSAIEVVSVCLSVCLSVCVWQAWAASKRQTFLPNLFTPTCRPRNWLRCIKKWRFCTDLRMSIWLYLVNSRVFEQSIYFAWYVRGLRFFYQTNGDKIVTKIFSQPNVVTVGSGYSNHVPRTRCYFQSFFCQPSGMI